MNGFTPINESAFMDLIETLPEGHRLAARSICLDLLFHARRNTGMKGGVDLKRGQVLYSQRGLAQRCYVSKQKTRTIISWLKKVHFLTQESTHPATIVSIIEFDRYIKDRKQTNAETNARPTHDQRTTNAVPKDKGKRVKEKSTLERAPDALQKPEEYIPFCFAEFLDLPEVPDKVYSLIDRAKKDGDRLQHLAAACQKQYRANWTIDDLKNVAHGKEVSTVIAYINKIADKAPQLSSNQQTIQAAYNIANSLGEPIQSPQERLERILEMELDHDPDPGHPWSISDEDIALAREGNAGQSQPDHTRSETP